MRACGCLGVDVGVARGVGGGGGSDGEVNDMSLAICHHRCT